MKFRTLFLALLLVASVMANSVELRIAGHMGASKSNDVLWLNGTSYDASASHNITNTPDKGYVAAEDSTDQTVMALVSSGSRLINSTATTNQTGSDFMIALAEGQESNSFLLLFTRGDHSDVEGDWNSVDKNKMLGTTFAGFSHTVPSEFSIFVILQYFDIDLVSDLQWAGGAYRLLLRNTGVNSIGNAKVNITLES